VQKNEMTLNECFYKWYCISLLCLLLGVRWHHDCIFSLLLGMWQTQDAYPYMILSLGLEQIVICLSTPTIGMRLSQWDHDEGDGLIFCEWHSQGYDPLIFVMFILVWPKVTQSGCFQNILLEISLQFHR
jgi:hypothetical protein